MTIIRNALYPAHSPPQTPSAKQMSPATPPPCSVLSAADTEPRPLPTSSAQSVSSKSTDMSQVLFSLTLTRQARDNASLPSNPVPVFSSPDSSDPERHNAPTPPNLFRIVPSASSPSPPFSSPKNQSPVAQKEDHHL